MTTYTVVSELDDPTWPCIECLPKVVSDFVGEQSRVHIMPISAKWKHKSSIHIGFIVFNWGVTTFFAKSVCVSDLTITDSDNSLSPGRRQAIIRTNAGILFIRPLGTNFYEILIEILLFSFKKMRLKVSSED